MSRDKHTGPKPPFERFVESFRREVDRAGAAGPVRVDRAARTAHVPTPARGEVEVDLEALYREYAFADPVHRGPALERAAQMIVRGRPHIPRETALARLVPDVRARVELPEPASYLRLGQPSPVSPLVFPLAEHLSLGLMCGFDAYLQGVGMEYLADWGLTADEALAVALENIRRHTPGEGLPLGRTRGVGGHGQESALLCLPEVLRRSPVRGDVVAAVPAASVLIVAGSDDLRALTALLGAALDAPPVNRIHPLPVRWTEGHWVPFEVPADHPLAAPLALARAVGTVAAYSEQTQLIYSAAEPGLPTHFSGPPMLGTDRVTGRPLIASTLTLGVPTLLPRGDVVGFIRRLSEAETAVVAVGRWDRVLAVIGHLLVPVGGYPERFRVDGEPTATELAAIGFDPDLPPTGGYGERIRVGRMTTEEIEAMGMPRRVARRIAERRGR